MKNYFYIKAIVLFILTFATSPTFAAPYCAVFSYGKQCQYYDWDSCQRAVGNEGACVINQGEAKAPLGNAPFCVVSGLATKCYYNDAKSCREDAARENAVCAINPNR